MVMKFLAIGSACIRINYTTFSRILQLLSHIQTRSVEIFVSFPFSLAWRSCTHPGCRIKSPIIIDIRNVIQRVVVKFIFIRPSSDGTYYGMVMSVRPSVRVSVRVSVRPSVRPSQFSALFSYML